MSVATIERLERAHSLHSPDVWTCQMSAAFVMASLSVSLSLTLVSYALMVEDIEIYFTPYDRGLSNLWRSNFAILNSRLTPIDRPKQRHFLETAKIGPIIHHLRNGARLNVSYYYSHIGSCIFGFH